MGKGTCENCNWKYGTKEGALFCSLIEDWNVPNSEEITDSSGITGNFVLKLSCQVFENTTCENWE